MHASIFRSVKQLQHYTFSLWNVDETGVTDMMDISKVKVTGSKAEMPLQVKK